MASVKRFGSGEFSYKGIEFTRNSEVPNGYFAAYTIWATAYSSKEYPDSLKETKQIIDEVVNKIMNSYLYNLNDIPKKDREHFAIRNRLIEKAFGNPGKLIKVFNGLYYIAIGNELVAIDNQEDEVGKPQWIAIEQSVKAKWYSDHHPTLKSLKRDLEI